MAGASAGAAPAVLLLGPTASGKSALAMALAERFSCEIVSVDSAQVYRGMDIGTAKPGAAERARVPHHLIDVVEPTEAYSAGRFRADALATAAGIGARERVALFAGGTMLYFRALSGGLSELPPASPEARAEIDRLAAERGWPGMHALLAEVDPETAARLEPADRQRIQRALEVHRVTGRALSSFHAGPRPRPAPFAALAIALEPSDRAALHRRIEARFRGMLAAGLLAELETLRSRHALTAAMPSMRSVGYRQAWETLEGLASTSTLEARGIAATRQLAKRQLTWLRAMEGVERFDCLRGDLEAAVAERVARYLGA